MAAALAAAPRTDEQTRLLVKHFIAVLEARAPGRSVEVRVPPYAAVQAVDGRAAHPGYAAGRGRDRRVDVAGAGRPERCPSPSAEAEGRLRASGERADLTAYLPLTESP